MDFSLIREKIYPYALPSDYAYSPERGLWDWYMLNLSLSQGRKWET